MKKWHLIDQQPSFHAQEGIAAQRYILKHTLGIHAVQSTPFYLPNCSKEVFTKHCELTSLFSLVRRHKDRSTFGVISVEQEDLLFLQNSEVIHLLYLLTI